jgi:hypothetical protein
MDVGLNGTTVLKVGQDDMWYVKNQSGSNIPKGTAVMAVGTLGASGRILVAPMVSNGTISPKYLLGITAEAIPNGIDGYVLAKGKLRQVNTSAYTDGQVLWCSPTVPGALTATEPQAPNLKLPIAFVVNAANNGTLAIRTTAGATLSEDNQVQFGTLANNDVLTYSTFAGRWQNVPIGNLAATLAFRTIAVTGSSSIVADSSADTLTVTAGTGITLAGNATTDTLTITNSAPDQVVSISGAGTTVVTGAYPSFIVTSNDQFVGTVTSVGVTAGSGISVAGSTITSSGTFTVTNSDRGSSQNIFKNIAVPTQTTITASSNNDTFTIKPGSGISATTTGNDITISNTDPGSAQNIFKNIAVAGQSTVIADVNNDTLTLAAGTNVTITTDATTDTITINSTAGGSGTVTSVDLTAGSGISVSGGPITTSGSITVNNTDKGSDQNIFKNVAVAGQSTVVADTNNDTLTLVAGTNVTITTDATTDSVTINASAPSNPTPGNAVYARDYAAPFAITSTWTMVNLNSTNIRVTPNKTFSADNRGYFFVTFEVEDLSAGPSFRFFKYKLYNADTASDVVGSESYWTGYMYGTTEVPYTTFSFHIPSDDTSVSAGDSIELQVQEISTGTAPDITYAALSYIDAA